jgi:hypothetical protein
LPADETEADNGQTQGAGQVQDHPAGVDSPSAGTSNG